MYLLLPGLVICCAVRPALPYIIWLVLNHPWNMCQKMTGSVASVWHIRYVNLVTQMFRLEKNGTQILKVKIFDIEFF